MGWDFRNRLGEEAVREIYMVVIGEERMGRGRKDGVYAHGFEVGCVG